MNEDLEDTIVIDEKNLKTGIVHKQHGAIYSSTYWHKIIIKNADSFTKEFVLTTIMNCLKDYDFTPVCYTVDFGYVSFLLKSCGAAIKELCKLNLEIPIENLPPFKISIILKFSNTKLLKVDIHTNINTVIEKRYNSETKELNLESFNSDIDLTEFCPLSQRIMFKYVLQISKKFEIVSLKLNNNNIEDISDLMILETETNLKTLKSIDLSKNKIKNKSLLKSLQKFPIEELNLDENPICENIEPRIYVKLIKNHCRRIKKLDGFALDERGLLKRRNFFCSEDVFELIDEFIEHYFTLYDSIDRNLLENLYHKNAMFSLSCRYIPGQSTSYGSRLTEFRKISRNIKTMLHTTRKDELVFIGNQNIIRVLTMLPTVEHDRCSFTVDVMQFTDTMIIFTVTGTFTETIKVFDKHTFAFSKTFVLLQDKGEYCIVNEICNVTNATTFQEINIFKNPAAPIRPLAYYIPTATNEVEKDDMIRGFAHITGLRLSLAKKCLEECQYNLHKALILCIDLLHSDHLKSFAFSNRLTQMPDVDEAVYSQQMERVIHVPAPVIAEQDIKPEIPSSSNLQQTSVPTTSNIKSSPNHSFTEESSAATTPLIPQSNALSSQPSSNLPTPPLEQPSTSSTQILDESVNSSISPARETSNALTPTAIPQFSLKIKTMDEINATLFTQEFENNINFQENGTVNNSNNANGNSNFPIAIENVKPEPMEIDMPGTVENIKPEPADSSVPEHNFPVKAEPEEPVKTEPMELPEFRDTMFDVATPPLDPNAQDPGPSLQGLRYRPRDCHVIVLQDADELIKDALNLPITTTLHDAKYKISRASRRLVGEHIFYAKYYKALGREFYRYKMHKEVETFLKDVLANVPRKIGMEVYCSFVLFEIQYGSLKVAEEMIENIAYNFKAETIIKLLQEHIHEKNLDFARDMFKKVVQLKLPEEKLQKLFEAYQVFESMFGNIDTIQSMNHLNEQILNVKREEMDVKPDVKDLETAAVGPPPNERAALFRSENFKLFRKGLLSIVSIGYKSNKEDVKNFQSCIENLSEMANDLLKKYPNDYNVHGIVCQVLWKYHFYDDVLLILETKSKMLKPIEMVYRVRNELMKGDEMAAFRTFIQYVRSATLIHLANLLEELIEFESNFAESSMNKCISSYELPEHKMKLLSIEYYTWALLNGSKEQLEYAENIFKRHIKPIELFHPNDVLSTSICKKYRDRYEKLNRLKFSIPEALTYVRNSKTVEMIIEATRALYYHHHVSKIYADKKRLISTLQGEKRIQYMISLAYFEALFGEGHSAISVINQMNLETRSLLGSQMALASCHIQLQEGHKAKSIVELIVVDVLQGLHPDVLEGIYKYYLEWIKTFQVDLLELGINISC